MTDTLPLSEVQISQMLLIVGNFKSESKRKLAILRQNTLEPLKEKQKSIWMSGLLKMFHIQFTVN